jgi:hypothetical protein
MKTEQEINDQITELLKVNSFLVSELDAERVKPDKNWDFMNDLSNDMNCISQSVNHLRWVLGE